MFKRGVPESKEKEQELIEELRSRLASRSPEQEQLEERKLNSDPFLRRYLRHCNWRVDKAYKILDYYLTTITALNEELLEESWIKYPKDIRELYVPQFGGVDYENRPVLYLSNLDERDGIAFIEQADEEKVNLVIDYVMKIHTTVENMVLARGVEYGVAILNVANVKYSQYLNKKGIDLILKLARKVEGHSPGVTGKVIVVNAPKIVKKLAAWAKRILTISTEVVIFDLHETDWKEKLREHVPLEALPAAFGGTLVPWTMK